MLDLVKNYMDSRHVADMYAAYKGASYKDTSHEFREMKSIPEHPTCLLFPDLQGDGPLFAAACPPGKYDVMAYFAEGVWPQGVCAVPTEPSNLSVGAGRSGEYIMCPGDVLFLGAYEILWKWFFVNKGNVLILLRSE